MTVDGVRSVHSIHNVVVDHGVLQAMWEELAGQAVYTAINSLSANHAYLKTLWRVLFVSADYTAR